MGWKRLLTCSSVSVVLALGAAGCQPAERGTAGSAASSSPAGRRTSVATLELTAVRVQPGDPDLGRALFRVQDLEGQSTDAATWASMVELARASVGGSPHRLTEDRRWGSVKAWAGATLVDVRWQGNAAYLYFDVGAAPEEQLQTVLRRLRAAGFTIVQGSAVSEVRPGTTIADMLAAQEADQGQ